MAAPRSVGPTVFLAYRQPSEHRWSLLECAANGCSSQCGTPETVTYSGNKSALFNGQLCVDLIAKVEGGHRLTTPASRRRHITHLRSTAPNSKRLDA